MFTCVMQKYDKMAYKMFSTSVYIIVVLVLVVLREDLIPCLFLCGYG